MGLPLIVLSCLAGAYAVHLPLRALVQLLKKVGPIEFRALAEQKREQAGAIAPLEIRVQQLEERVKPLLASTPLEAAVAPPMADWKTVLANDELAQNVLRFLQNYDRWFFNASRIRRWGSTRRGYKDLDRPESEIEQRLRQLLAAGKLRVKISRLGTTLYGAK